LYSCILLKDGQLYCGHCTYKIGETEENQWGGGVEGMNTSLEDADVQGLRDSLGSMGWSFDTDEVTLALTNGTVMPADPDAKLKDELKVAAQQLGLLDRALSKLKEHGTKAGEDIKNLQKVTLPYRYESEKMFIVYL